MTDETKALLKQYFALKQDTPSKYDEDRLRTFTEDLCTATQDDRDTFADALKLAAELESLNAPKPRAPRKDKGTSRKPKIVTGSQAVA